MAFAPSALRRAGAKLFFLPPYSPDLNPIEQVFAKLKTLLRKANERSPTATWQRIGQLLDRFDPDEAMLRMTAESPLVGADRIIWASDYPHPDAKFPGVTEELTEALDGLSNESKRQITSESALALYGIG